MKKIRTAAIILAAAILSFAFVGCSSDSNSEKSSTKGAFLMFCINAITDDSAGSPVGTWKVTGGEAMGTTVTEDQLGDTSGSVFTLNADGTVTAGGETVGSWSLSGSKLTLVENGTSLDCEYNGTNIIIDMGIMKVIYSRV